MRFDIPLSLNVTSVNLHCIAKQFVLDVYVTRQAKRDLQGDDVIM